MHLLSVNASRDDNTAGQSFAVDDWHWRSTTRGVLIGLTLIPGGLPIAGTLATKIGLLGGALVLGGVAQLLTPTPEIPQGPDTVQDPRKSFSFSGVQNTSRGGTPVPIVYGKTLTGSVVISAGIDTEQVRA